MFENPNADAGSSAATIPMQAHGGQIKSPLDLMQGAYTLFDLMQKTKILGNEATKSNIETADMLATREAVAKNTHQDQNTGMINVNFEGTLKDLAQKSPTAALNFQLSMQQRQAEVAEKQAQLQQTQLSNATSKVNLVGQLVQQVNSQQDLDMVRKLAPTFGIDAAQIPDEYDPAVKGQLVSQAVKASEMLTHKLETARLGLAATKQTAELSQMDASATNEVVGQYKDDPLTREYVKLSNTHTTFKSMEATKDFSQGLKDRDLLYNFQNIINPNMSATGGTIEQDEETRGMLEGMGVDVKKVLNGDSLSPSQRQQISSFIEEKFKQSTLQQQAVFNQYQNRLIGLRAQGRNIDPYHALPVYGDVVNHVPNNWGEYSGGIPQINEADLATDPTLARAVGGKGAAVPPPAMGEASPAKVSATANAPMFAIKDINARAERTGENPADIVAAIKAKGGRVEGE